MSDRSYLVRVEDQLQHRNRKFLKPSVHSPDTNAEEMSSEIGHPTKALPEEVTMGSNNQQVVASGSANTLTPESLEAGCKESVDPPESVRGTTTESVASPEQRPYITRSGRSVKPPATRRYKDMGK